MAYVTKAKVCLEKSQSAEGKSEQSIRKVFEDYLKIVLQFTSYFVGSVKIFFATAPPVWMGCFQGRTAQ